MSTPGVFKLESAHVTAIFRALLMTGDLDARTLIIAATALDLDVEALVEGVPSVERPPRRFPLIEACDDER